LNEVTGEYELVEVLAGAPRPVLTVANHYDQFLSEELAVVLKIDIRHVSGRKGKVANQYTTTTSAKHTAWQLRQREGDAWLISKIVGRAAPYSHAGPRGLSVRNWRSETA
jgi:hypothetical protein